MRHGTGLTPAFLVGALREPAGTVASPSASFRDLRLLLESMRDTRLPYGKVVKIFECQNIMQPVVTLSSDRTGTPIGDARNAARLFCWEWYEPERQVDFDWLVHALWCHYRAAICHGHFSYKARTKQFQAFDETDCKFIASALREEDE